ncbi:hypothetical protein K2173_005113 [Erythroxylum novogranatense]|uniref:inositol-3-phosphate synthase n=1 Tax=Erythroxylum novogranatense TaxID=1862640 RepID=A0AAV8TBR9_9ROSI|nr:hypothetical protein K2173_005113 [Erythroxylum novogranatense]
MYDPFKSPLPRVNPNDDVFGEWEFHELSKLPRLGLTFWTLICKSNFRPYMESLVLLPGIYDPDLIAVNQDSHVNNVIKGTKKEQVQQIIKDIKENEEKNKVEKVILWTANTERVVRPRSVLVDFVVDAGVKPSSIVSYNHLGNNDMKLSVPQTFSSKEILKINVVDDMVSSNAILCEPDEHPNHVVFIKYVPYGEASKRATDDYKSEIFMGGKNSILLHNTCEDSLLAAPTI